MNKTSIEWTDYTWNPVTGCHKVSQGCKNCYAETMTNRFAKTWGVENFRQVVCHQDRLMEPCYAGDKLHGKRVFVCDMSDLFHEDVPFEFIDRVYQVIGDLANFKRIRTTWQILTKRPERMLEYHKQNPLRVPQIADIWHGVSLEDQATADQRIPLLLQVPSAVRFLSCEPLLERIDLAQPLDIFLKQSIDFNPVLSKRIFEGKVRINELIHWVICGGESGHKARPMHPDWARSLRDQCAAAGVPFFFKQWGQFIPSYQAGEKSDEIADYNQTFGDRWAKKARSFPDGLQMVPVGKSNSGNFLDGKQHLEFPMSQTAQI